MPKGGFRVGAGRKPIEFEIKKRANIEQLSCLCVDHLVAIMNNPKIANGEKTKIALAIAPKLVSQNINHSGEVSHNIFLNDVIEKSRTIDG